MQRLPIGTRITNYEPPGLSNDYKGKMTYGIIVAYHNEYNLLVHFDNTKYNISYDGDVIFDSWVKIDKEYYRTKKLERIIND